MGMQVTISISGDKEVSRKLNRLGKSLYKFKKAMKLIGEETTKYYANDAFNSQGGVFGEKWSPLSPKYAAWKAKNFPGAPILSREGVPGMRDSFEYTATETDVIVSNSTEYFKYHQSSLPRKSNLPRRKMIGINSKVRRIVKDAITEDVKEKLRRA